MSIYKTLGNAPVEHLFGCHEWCGSSWCYAKEIDKAREKIGAAVAAAAPSHPPAATATGGAEVLSRSPTEVVSPIDNIPGRNNTAVTATCQVLKVDKNTQHE